MADMKMNIILTVLLAMLLFTPVKWTPYPSCASTATPPPSETKCNWYCSDLKYDWYYLFHPKWINQCEPRDLKDYKLEIPGIPVTR